MIILVAFNEYVAIAKILNQCWTKVGHIWLLSLNSKINTLFKKTTPETEHQNYLRKSLLIILLEVLMEVYL